MGDPAVTLMQSVTVLFALVFVPLYLASGVWLAGRALSKLTWWLRVAYHLGILIFLFMAAPWHWVSYYLRYAWLLAGVALAVRSWRAVREKPFLWTGPSAFVDVVLVAVAAVLVGLALPGYFFSEEPVELAFPLKDGAYVVGQGGNSPILNYHNVYESQKYALDIAALNAWGARAAGLYPSDVTRYAIFGHTVYSPCDGTVTRAVDGLPDLSPPEADPENRAGNHVVVACKGVNVLLAHLRQGSVAVREGDEVVTGEPIGQIGNSGNTSEPHLHVHAVRADDSASFEGHGVPILFDGRFLAKNAVVRR